ncbi:hypothetical protein [Aquimarina intermedia]|uniref:DoxX-like protein n=1 Tax=Aquimarina intermedia TaxID=350814 RepID=A0A5S5C8T2_9FLAO|nr:hypothetical protein [Aquimarina intermedia]TYP74393.1 hypothetical protein BD809_104213 [Aquimarina intermedia]
MKNKISIFIAVLLLGYGIIRVGVGGALLAQTFEIVNISELNEATLEVKQFIDARASKQQVSLTPIEYFAYISMMGVLLTVGAIGIIARKKWGFILLWIYIASHAALFINFKEINPKIFVLLLQVILLVVLIYLRPSRSSYALEETN